MQAPNFSNLESVLDRQRKQSNQMTKNLPGKVKGYGEQQKQGAYGQLDRQREQNMKKFSSRGLLHSGLRQAEDAGASGQMAAQLANRQQDFGAQARQQAYGASDAANATGLMLQGAKQSVFDADRAAAQQELDLMRGAQGRRDEALGGVMSGLGSLAGGYLGGRTQGPSRAHEMGGNPTNDTKLLQYRSNYMRQP